MVRKTVEWRFRISKLKSISFKYFMTYTLDASVKDLLWCSLRWPELSTGFHWIFRIRAGAFTLSRQARHFMIQSNAVDECPCCLTKVIGGDSLDHYLFRCKTFRSVRMSLPIQRLTKKIAKAALTGVGPHGGGTTLTEPELVALLIGGTLPARDLSLASAQISDLLAQELKDALKISFLPQGPRAGLRLGYLLLASFLKDTIQTRHSLLFVKSTCENPFGGSSSQCPHGSG
jgi:hypothetical protein